MGWPARLFTRARALRRRPRPEDRRRRLRDQPPALDRHPARRPRSRRATCTSSRRPRRRTSRRSARPAPARRDRDPPRRVRPRRRAAHARGGAGRARGRPLRRGHAPEDRPPGRRAAGRGDGRAAGGRAGRPCRDLRDAVLEARQLPPLHGRVRRAARFDGLPKNGKGYREATAAIERRIHELFDSRAPTDRPRTRAAADEQHRASTREPSRSSASRTSASRRSSTA